jgi:hypothetical protein
VPEDGIEPPDPRPVGDEGIKAVRSYAHHFWYPKKKNMITIAARTM